MSPLPNPQQVQRGDTPVAAAAQSASVAALMREEAARIAAERQLVQHVQEMSARVAALESLVARLAACAVQQHWDGRLFLPTHNRLTLEVEVNGVTFSIKALPHTMLEPPVAAPWPLAQSEPDVALRRPAPALAPQGSSVQQMAAGSSASSWQSIAASNSTENPRQLAPGVSLNPKP